MRSSRRLWPPAPAPCSSRASWTRLRRWRCGRSSTRTMERRDPEPGGRPLDARSGGRRARTARLRTRARGAGEGGGGADRHEPKLARSQRVGGPGRGAGGRGKPSRGRARARLGGALLRRRGGDRCTTRGCSSSWPASACAADVSWRPRQHCVPCWRRSASSRTAGPFPCLPRRSSGSSRRREAARRAGSCSSRRARPSSRC